MGDLFYGEQALGRKEISGAAELYMQAALKNEPQVPESANGLKSNLEWSELFNKWLISSHYLGEKTLS